MKVVQILGSQFSEDAKKSREPFILSQGNGAGAGELRNELDAARWLILSEAKDHQRSRVGWGQFITSEAKDHQQSWAVAGNDR